MSKAVQFFLILFLASAGISPAATISLHGKILSSGSKAPLDSVIVRLCATKIDAVYSKKDGSFVLGDPVSVSPHFRAQISPVALKIISGHLT